MAHPLRVAPAETLAGNRTLTTAEVKQYGIWTFDPTAARDLTLPAVADNVGQIVVVSNTADAAEVITIKDGTGTVCTPTQAESAFCWCDGVRWRGIAGANS